MSHAKMKSVLKKKDFSLASLHTRSCMLNHHEAKLATNILEHSDLVKVQKRREREILPPDSNMTCGYQSRDDYIYTKTNDENI